MHYRLALDIGTASCGWVAVSLDSDNQPIDVVHHSAHIFPEPLLPAQSGVGEPIAYASRGLTLHPGELLTTGTLPGCSALELQRELVFGDEGVFDVDQIGELKVKIRGPRTAV
jgi:hypothetical protein